MATATPEAQPVEESRDKGLKGGALGLVSSVVMGVASTAPAYSLAATLLFVVVLVGFKAPAVALLAFIPILFCSIGYSEMNKADPDCGTTFTWATRAFGPKTGWAGGWGIVAADILVMASLAQVAGQYVFLLIQGPNSSIGTNPASGWVLLVGVIWIVAMTYICYRGIEVSANFQKVLLSIELVMLAGALGDGAGQGRDRASPGRRRCIRASAGCPDPPAALGLPRRDHPDAVHLLGLGHRRLGQRGNQGQEQDPGPGGHHLDRAAAGHLRDRDLLGGVVRRHRHEGDRAVQPGHTAATCCRCSAARSSAAARSAPRCPGC